ncbi:DNA-binding response regulator [Dehalococcoides mccartyi]|uniref:DNA-binding response regulator n=1 Tax=Dehalococcoides mccartyi TaxID=61435 RepID=A0A2J1E058_9CHLR|nr:DNA-binding response regulator [Dehalococcoides mccartyi]
MAKECILLIDDITDTTAIVSLLKAAEYQIILAKNETDGLKKASQFHADLVIVNQTHIKLLQHELSLLIRQLSYMPILVLGSQNEAAEILELGADSFISSPPNPRELKARINSILRPKRKLPPHKIDGSNNESNSNTLNLKTSYKLNPTENRLDSCLKQNQGHLIEYQSLINAMWGEDKIRLDILHYYMRRLKSKVSFPRIIQQRGIGYLLDRS